MNPIVFNSTVWTLVQRAAHDKKALSELLELYRAPIVNFLLASGRSEADAEDIAQEVFLRAGRPAFFETALRLRGKFRSLLLAVTRRATVDFDRIRKAAKRGGGSEPLSLDELRERDTSFDLSDSRSGQDDTFDRIWVQNLVRQALVRYQTWCVKRRSAHYDIFCDCALRGMKQEAASEKYGVKVQNIKNAVFAAKRKLREFVEDLIRDYSMSREEFATELQRLGKFFNL